MTDQNPKAFFPKLQSMARLTTHQLSLIEDKAYKRSNTTDNIEKACQQINSILVQESSMMETLQASITKVTSTFQNSDTVMSAGKRLLDHLTDDVNQLNKLLQTYGYQRPECDIDNSEHDHDAAVKNVVDVCAIYNNAGSAKENIAPDADSRDKSETLSDVDNAQLMALIMKYSKPICVFRADEVTLSNTDCNTRSYLTDSNQSAGTIYNNQSISSHNCQPYTLYAQSSVAAVPYPANSTLFTYQSHLGLSTHTPKQNFPHSHAPPSSHISAPPSSHISAPPSSHISAPPSSHISAPPSSHISAPPSSHISAPPSSHISALPSSHIPAPPSSHIPAPPSSHISAPPSSHNLAPTCYTRTRLQYNAVSDSTEDEPKTPQHKDDSPFIDAVVITPGLYDGRLVPLTTPYHTGAYVDIISYEHLLPDQMQHAAPKAWEREARPSTPSMLCTPKYHYGSATFIAPSDDTNINSPLRPTFLTPALQRMMNKHYETPQQASSNSLGQGDAGGDIGDGCVGSSLDDSLELPVFKTAAFRHLYSGKTNKTKSYTATTTLPVSTNIHTPRQDALPASANNSMHNSHLSITTMSTVNTDLTVTVNRSVIGDISGIGTLDDSLELPTMRTQCFQELLDEMKAKRNQSQLESTTLANSTQAINDKTTNTAVAAAPASSKAAVATTADTVTVATTADTVTAATTVANTITTATIEADTTATAIATTSSNIITVHSNNKTMDTVFSDEGACDDNSAAMHNYEQESEDASSEKESKKSKSRKSFLGQPMEYISPVTELEYSQLPVYLKYASLKLINEAVALLNDVITFRMSEEGDSIVYDSDLDSLDSIKRPQERHTILYGLVQLQRIYRSSSDKTIFHLQ